MSVGEERDRANEGLQPTRLRQVFGVPEGEVLRDRCAGRRRFKRSRTAKKQNDVLPHAVASNSAHYVS